MPWIQIAISQVATQTTVWLATGSATLALGASLAVGFGLLAICRSIVGPNR